MTIPMLASLGLIRRYVIGMSAKHEQLLSKNGKRSLDGCIAPETTYPLMMYGTQAAIAVLDLGDHKELMALAHSCRYGSMTC